MTNLKYHDIYIYILNNRIENNNNSIDNILIKILTHTKIMENINQQKISIVNIYLLVKYPKYHDIYIYIKINFK